MSEEEKQAIRNLENLSEFGLSTSLNQLDLDKMKIILNLIEKQQKDYISKDKIREKIEFYKRYGKIENSNEYVMSVEIEVLEELLEEGE